MSKVLKLKCVKCGREFKETEVLYTCPDCGIEGILDVELDYDLIRKELNREYLKNNRNYSLWRYLPATRGGYQGIQPLQAVDTSLQYSLKQD